MRRVEYWKNIEEKENKGLSKDGPEFVRDRKLFRKDFLRLLEVNKDIVPEKFKGALF